MRAAGKARIRRVARRKRVAGKNRPEIGLPVTTILSLYSSMQRIRDCKLQKLRPEFQAIANIQKGTYLIWKGGLDQLEQYLALNLEETDWERFMKGVPLILWVARGFNAIL
jgi:hypothetical protein